MPEMGEKHLMKWGIGVLGLIFVLIFVSNSWINKQVDEVGKIDRPAYVPIPPPVVENDTPIVKTSLPQDGIVMPDPIIPQEKPPAPSEPAAASADKPDIKKIYELPLDDAILVQ